MAALGRWTRGDGRINPAYLPPPVFSQQLTNEHQQGRKTKARYQPLCQLRGRRLRPDRKSVEDTRQHRPQGRSPGGLLRKLRRAWLLNDGSRGPCGRIDQIGSLSPSGRGVGERGVSWLALA